MSLKIINLRIQPHLPRDNALKMPALEGCVVSYYGMECSAGLPGDLTKRCMAARCPGMHRINVCLCDTEHLYENIESIENLHKCHTTFIEFFKVNIFCVTYFLMREICCVKSQTVYIIGNFCGKYESHTMQLHNADFFQRTFDPHIDSKFTGDLVNFYITFTEVYMYIS